MQKIVSILCLAIVLLSCQNDPKPWQFQSEIQLADVHPIGLSATTNGLWLSDGDNNRLVLINLAGEIQQTIDSLDRPMHISTMNSDIYIPQYGNDTVAIYKSNTLTSMFLNEALDAPAAVDTDGEHTVIADFYNHRILLIKQDDPTLSIGEEGKANGQLYYPTDVQLSDETIWVADAYNHRVQVFDFDGNHLLTLADNQKINAATGIWVTNKEVFVTDFENNRVLIFTKEGTLLQIIDANIEKPTDVLVYNNSLYITNYRRGSISVFTN